MSFFADTMEVSFLGYASIFLCIGTGFFFIKKVDTDDSGPGWWSVAFLLNSAGFVFWSGAVPLLPWQYFLLGEICHFSGFVILVCGVYRFTGREFRPWNVFALAVVLLLWVFVIRLFTSHRDVSTILLRVLRSFLFFSAGFLILRKMPKGEIVGRRLAGTSLTMWGLYGLVYGFIRIDSLRDLIFGLLVGFQVLAAFGLVVMVIDRIRIRSEENEKRVMQLEKLLPICSYCKKIRDKKDNWHKIENYIEERTSFQFTHGICPGCMEKNFPEYAKSKKSTMPPG